MESALKKVRVDKWLWSVRIYKSRTLSTEACKKGQIKIKGKSIKPSYMLTPEETLEVHKNGFNLIFKAKTLISKRVSASLAQECYEHNTPESELNKYSDWFVGKGHPEVRERGTGRPTKRERREIDDFKVGAMWDEEE
jgi:ribosome-associated heat shock protein Hsp15